MLPDFTSLKRERLQNENHDLSKRIEQGTPLSKIRSFRIHEGDRWTIFREDGSRETSTPKRHESLVEMSRKDVHNKGEQAIQEAFSKIQADIKKSKMRLFYQTLDETIEESGNSFDARGNPVSAEMILQMWEGMELSFDEWRNWLKPSIICNPVQTQRLKAEMNRFETDPNLKAKLNDLIQRKREEWNVREANRKLAD